jgi:excisionase family DNA binding protein
VTNPFAQKPAEAPQKPAEPTTPETLLVDAVTAARLLGISRTTLDKLVRDGRLARVKLAGRVLFSTELLRKIAGGEA